MTFQEAQAALTAQAQKLSHERFLTEQNRANAAHVQAVNDSNRRHLESQNAAHQAWLSGQKK